MSESITSAKMSFAEELSLIKKQVQPFLEVRKSIYWFDLLITGGAAWGLLFLTAKLAFESGGGSPAGSASWLPPSLLWLTGLFASFFVYRGVYFIHELAHQSRESLPGFFMVWHFLFGIPFMSPFFIYGAIHRYHHWQEGYGTLLDGEYIDASSWRFGSSSVVKNALVWMGLFIGNIFLPVFFVLRFSVLSLCNLFSPRLRRVIMQKFTVVALRFPYQIQPTEGFVRQSQWVLYETLTSLWVWAWISVGVLCWYRVPTEAGLGFFTPVFSMLSSDVFVKTILVYYFVWMFSAQWNVLRVLFFTHGYHSQGQTSSFEFQLQDSVNIISGGLLTEIFCPAGLRYHALHHLIPSLPYHSLPKAHRRLLAVLPLESRYRQSCLTLSKAVSRHLGT